MPVQGPLKIEQNYDAGASHDDLICYLTDRHEIHKTTEKMLKLISC